MTTGNVSSVVVAETLPDGWKLYLSKYKSWTGGNSPSNPPTKTKVYVPLVKPAKFGWRRFKVPIPPKMVSLFRKDGKPKTGAPLRYAQSRNSVPKKVRYNYVLRYVELKPAIVVQKRVFPATPKRSRTYQENSYTMYGKETRESYFIATRNGSGFYPGVIGEQHANSFVSSLWESTDDYALIEKLQARILGSTVHLGNSLGESHKTLSFIGSAAQRIGRSLAEVRKGRFFAAVKTLEGKAPSSKHANASVKDPASAWLEYTYALTPLLKDVQEAAQFMGFTLAAPRTHLETVTRNARGKYFHVHYNDQVWGFSSSSKVIVPIEVNYSKRLKAKLFEVDITQMSGLVDVSSVLWEVTPYSFVADWFLPIGRYLSARNVLGSISGEYTVTTRIKQSTWAPTIRNDNSSDVYAFSKKPIEYYSRSTSITRTVGTSFVPERPRFRPLEKTASFSHCITSIALLISRFGSR